MSYQGQTGPFTGLQAVAPGAAVRVLSADGSALSYVVQTVRRARKDALDRAALFTAQGPPRLALVTCGGRYNRRSRSYEENVVVAVLR